MMSENSTIPYLLQLKDAVNAIHLSENKINNVEVPRAVSIVESANIALIPSYDVGIPQICGQQQNQIVEKSVDNIMEIESHSIEETTNNDVNFVYEIVCPEQLNLRPVYNLKRGRPKKKKKVVEIMPVEPPKPVKPPPRTRSGRLVKFPKYIEKDFKKVEIEEGTLENEEPELKTSEFIRFADEKQPSIKSNKPTELQLEFHQRRRKISAQYRCPKCNKAYLGKFRMVQHLKKYPDHGPVPHNELNFDVWNYLVDITQKCPPSQRGVKFCEELTNLLHNVLLLTSALFKKAELNKNNVDVDKVLGNAIGLPPGPYKFNDSELYKDVTVLKLITNSDFFKPVEREEDGDNGEMVLVDTTETKCEYNLSLNNTVNNVKIIKKCEEKDKIDVNEYFNEVNENSTKKSYIVNNSGENSHSSENVPCNIEISSQNFIKESRSSDKLVVQTELLSDSSLLNIPNLRNSVDELIMSGTNLLDNSTSSDEVMNVDQFVNERFKKITEPEIELGGGGLNLDLPSLDLFQFHDS